VDVYPHTLEDILEHDLRFPEPLRREAQQSGAVRVLVVVSDGRNLSRSTEEFPSRVGNRLTSGFRPGLLVTRNGAWDNDTSRHHSLHSVYGCDGEGGAPYDATLRFLSSPSLTNYLVLIFSTSEALPMGSLLGDIVLPRLNMDAVCEKWNTAQNEAGISPPVWITGNRPRRCCAFK
jgi:hypothetical protein